MALKSTQEQLEEVQAAISECLVSQEMGGPEASIRRARLKELTDYEAILLGRLSREQGTGGLTHNVGIIRRD